MVALKQSEPQPGLRSADSVSRMFQEGSEHLAGLRGTVDSSDNVFVVSLAEEGSQLPRPFPGLFMVVAFGTAALGYVSTLLSTVSLMPLVVVIFTLATLAWLGCCQLLRYRAECERFALSGLLLLICVAVLSLSSLGLSLDWLLVAVTVGVLAVLHSFRFALFASLGLWVAMLAFLFLPQRSLDLLSLASLTSPLLFSFAFAAALRRMLQIQKQTHMLLARLEHSNAALQTAHGQLQQFAGEIEVLSAAQERTRIAREIHDTLGHYLSLLSVQLETALKLQERQDPDLARELGEARRVCKECIQEVRYAVTALRPEQHALTPLGEMMQQLVVSFEEHCSGVSVVLDLEGESTRLPTEVRMALYRCAQEALTNVRKHSRTSRIFFRLLVDEQSVELTVLDSGPSQAETIHNQVQGFGLQGVRERVALLAGTVRVGPEPGGGWRVEIILPLSREGPGPSLPLVPKDEHVSLRET